MSAPLLAGLGILVLGEAARALAPADRIAIVVAAVLTVASWWLVQQWGLYNLYELVPAFFTAGFAALAVSAVTRPYVEEPED